MAELKYESSLRGHGLATPDELALRHKFQEEIEARRIGNELGGGSGLGEMDILVDVADSEIAKTSSSSTRRTSSALQTSRLSTNASKCSHSPY